MRVEGKARGKSVPLVNRLSRERRRTVQRNCCKNPNWREWRHSSGEVHRHRWVHRIPKSPRPPSVRKRRLQRNICVTDNDEVTYWKIPGSQEETDKGEKTTMYVAGTAITSRGYVSGKRAGILQKIARLSRWARRRKKKRKKQKKKKKKEILKMRFLCRIVMG